MRRWRIALATGLLVAGLPAMSQATQPLPLFTFVASPLIVSVGDVTDYTFTFTNLGPVGSQKVRCAEVLFPDELWISSVGTPTASNGGPWTAGLQGQWVVAESGGGAYLKVGESVTYTVTALATSAGAFTFDNHVHSASGCDDSNNNGIPVPLTVLPGIVPTPTPTPTATPKPTAVPTPIPTPRPTPVATPDRSTPTPSPTPTPTPEASPTERPPAPSAVPSPDASSGATGIRVAPLGGGGDGHATDSLGMGVDVLGLLDSPFEWLVPGAFVGGPGLLVLVFVALQAAGALAWIPAVRRMGEDDPDDRRRRRGRRVSRGA